MIQITNPNPNPNSNSNLNPNQPAPALAPFTPRIPAPTLAAQFLGQLDPGTVGALAPASTDLVVSPGTFLGLPVREEPFRHVNPTNLPASYHNPANAPVGSLIGTHSASPAHPLIELAVLVPTAAGGVPAFPGDWIVQGAEGYSVWSDQKFRAEFDVPASVDAASGSGTGRYGEGDNWTQHSDGTDYPGSYGVGPDGFGSDGQPLKPFVPFKVVGSSSVQPGAFAVPSVQPDASGVPAVQPNTFTVGSAFRILRANQTVDPAVHVITAINLGVVTYEADGETLEVSRDHIVAVKK